MKKKLLRLLLISAILPVTLLAKHPSSYAKLPPYKNVCDTLKNYIGSDYTLYLINAIDNQNTGYLSGTNSYMDLAKAEKYTAPLPGKQLTGVNVLFAIAKSTDSRSTVKINVWANDGDEGTPGTVITSTEINIESIKENKFMFVPFDNAVSLSGNFYVGFDIPTGHQDTVAIATCKSGAGTDNTGWEQASGGTWHTYASANMDLQASNIIFPVFCTITSTVKDPILAKKVLIYPNPTTHAINVVINNDKNAPITIYVYSSLGELITRTDKNSGFGELFHLNMSNTSPGFYYVTIIIDEEKITERVLFNP